MNQGPRAVIFDLDGTLVDSLRDIATALNEALAAHGVPAVAARDVRRWVGDGIGMLCRRAAPEADEATLASMERALVAAYERHTLDTTRTYPGIDAVLTTLRRRRIAMAVLSNKPDRFTRRVVEAVMGNAGFAVVRGVRVEAERKPAPGVALEIAAALARPPQCVYFVGDSAVDVETARAAGMPAVCVTWGFRDRGELAALAPDFIVDEPAALLRLPGLDGATDPE